MTPKILALLVIGLSASVSLLWQSGSLGKWLKNRAIQAYLERLQPHLPFEIEKVELDANLEDLLGGEVSMLRVWLRKDVWQARLAGRLAVRKEGESEFFSIHYLPEVLLRNDEWRVGATPLQLNLVMRLAQGEDTTVKELGWSLRPQGGAGALGFEWKPLGLETGGFVLGGAVQLKKDGPRSTLSFSGTEVLWTSSDETLSVGVQSPSAYFIVDPSMNGEGAVSASSLEILWGEDFYSFNLANLKNSIRWNSANRTFELSQEGFYKIGGQLIGESRLDLDWHLGKLSVPRLVSWLGSLEAVADRLEGWEIQEGILESTGGARLNLVNRKLDTIELKAWGTGLRARRSEPELGWKGMNVSATYSQGGGTLSWEVERFFFKRLLGRVERRELEFSSSPDGVHGVWAELRPDIGLRLDEVPLELAPVKMESSSEGIRVSTQVAIPPVQLKSLARAFCLEEKDFPDARLHADFSSIQFGNGNFKLSGEAKVRLFEGVIEIGDLEAFDLLSEVPEVNFDAEWRGIRLDRLGKWLSFGEMDGTVAGFAKGVVFQSWLPTHYDFEFRILPFKERQVVFSSRAMKNTVRMISGDNLEETVPGFADFLAFGWVSQLLGGYNVQYAGVSLYAAQGSIILKTFDPEEILQREGKHFILYGPRFKIPIRSHRYPVVLDAPAMGNLAYHMAKQLEALKDSGDDDAKGVESELEKETEDANQNCLPPVF